MNFIDFHCDTITESCITGKDLLDGDLHVTIQKARPFRRWSQVFAIFLDDEVHGVEAVAKFKNYLDFFDKTVSRYSDHVKLCTTAADFQRTYHEGKCAAILAVENAVSLGGKLENLREAHSRGVRMIGLTWNGINELGSGSLKDGGLTRFGKKVVELAAELRMILDLSHLSDRGFNDVIALTDTPIIASHSNARAVCANPRNLTDDQIRQLIARKGLIGLNLHRPFLAKTENEANRIASVFCHVDHLLSLGAEDYVVSGSDFDGALMPAFCQDISFIPDLYEAFERRYGLVQTEKVFFQNAFNFLNSSL